MEMTIDLSILKNNAKNIKLNVRSGLIAVVKCNAYGHGDIECSKALKNIADAFAVATTEEALRLVIAGITKDVLVLSQIYDGSDYPDNVIFCAFDKKSLGKLIESKRRYAIKIDTGMNRLGFSPSAFLSVVNNINFDKVHSVFSHVYDNSAVVRQYDEFCSVTDSLNVKRHIFASNSVFFGADSSDWVRPGLLLYGYGANYVRPVMKLSARVLQVRHVFAGENVGYGICPVKKDCVLATIDIGYGDGFRRKKCGEERFVFIGGKKRKIIGQICMDMCMAEADESVKAGDEAIILDEKMDANALAAQWNTITYDVLTSLGKARAKRKYVK